MADLTVTESDYREAEDFLVKFMGDTFPDIDLSRGSVTRDHTVSAIAAAVALLRKEAATIRNATSFNTISLISDQTDRDQAAENLASNWFITRKTGRPVRGTGVILFSQLHDGVIPTGIVFTRTPGRRFFIDGTSAYVYTSTQLRPRYSSSGVVTAYELRVPLVAEGVGSVYEVPAGSFTGVPKFNRYVTGMENDEAFTGATDTETTDAMLERAKTAITVRDLNSVRSISTVLQDLFSDVDGVSVIGMGEAGMVRDRADFPSAVVHVGGCTDIYGTSPLYTNRTYDATVGGVFTDPRREVKLFRDATVDDWRSFNVQVGDVIFHRNSDSSERELYTISRVSRYFLEVSRKQAFPDQRPTPARQDWPDDVAATDLQTLVSPLAEFSQNDVGRYVRIVGAANAVNNADRIVVSVDAGANSVVLSPGDMVVEAGMTIEVYDRLVEYSIGSYAPTFDQKVLTRTTGEFTRNYKEEGCILLPSHPVYLIRDVSVLNAADPLTDPLTGRIQFSNRTNVTPADTDSSALLEYQVINYEPAEAQSAEQFLIVKLGPAPSHVGYSGVMSGANVFTSSTNVFSIADVGKRLTVIRAFNDINRGAFVITAYTSPTQVTVQRLDDPLAVTTAETRLEWELSRVSRFDGYPVRVAYDTVASFDSVSAYVSDRQNRVICADTLYRTHHPVYLRFELRYGLKSTSTGVFDETSAKGELARFINEFPSGTDVLHVSDLVTFFQGTYSSSVGYVEVPFTIEYDLYAPDGRVIPYRTVDAVQLKAHLQASSDADYILDDPAYYGVTERTIRYLSDTSLITLTRVS